MPINTPEENSMVHLRPPWASQQSTETLEVESSRSSNSAVANSEASASYGRSRVVSASSAIDDVALSSSELLISSVSFPVLMTLVLSAAVVVYDDSLRYLTHKKMVAAVVASRRWYEQGATRTERVVFCWIVTVRFLSASNKNDGVCYSGTIHGKTDV